MALSTVESVDLIKKYRETKDINIRNKIILRYGDMVKYIAVSMRNMYLKFAEVSDIVDEGIICLVGAIDTFDETKNVKFETYASLKIRGGIIDYIRKQDFIPRNVRKFAREADDANSCLYTKLGRHPEDKEVAEYLGIDEKKYNKMMGQSASLNTLSFEELLYETNFDMGDDKSSEEWSCERGILSQERKQVMIEAINSLKEKEKQVISLYYYEKLKFSEIAQVLEISESRVCQIHSQAIGRLKKSLMDYLG